MACVITLYLLSSVVGSEDPKLSTQSLLAISLKCDPPNAVAADVFVLVAATATARNDKDKKAWAHCRQHQR
jgi:hypothetical protein